MKLTKHEHACVTLEKDGTTIVIDPGVFASAVEDVIAAADAVLVTHEHPDHVDEGVLKKALASRPELRVYGPKALAGKFGAQFVAVGAGDGFDAGGFHVTVHGGEHAVIHPDIPTVSNVGFLVDESVYHPGDAYYAPGVPVHTLLVPTSGPWCKVGETVDFVRAVSPEQSIQIHEMLLSDIGLGLAASMLGKDGLTGIPFSALKAGSSVTI
ncbi:MAG TPA: MBL fold metallo-hydrolase [Trebonia sp.]|jgi:L-ascorbate metabolism protein UlaG (beta-lactamase superfamily)|nr:MBL fold metallo-hydrolase [Trebonia sp.]